MQRLPSIPRAGHQKSEGRRVLGAGYKSRHWVLCVVWVLAFALLFAWQRVQIVKYAPIRQGEVVEAALPFPTLRRHVFNLTDFGAVGDGRALNTHAFEAAVAAIRAVSGDGGGQLNVGRGRWLTAPFNLTSHMTLFLAKDAVVLGIEDESYWPILPPLPSYGRGREYPGPRYGSLIHGQNLEDIVITGHNGTIDGQGQRWWRKFRQKKSRRTRPCLVQFQWSSNIEVSNVTLRNSPFWTFHPYDCKNVTVRGVTVLAPESSPNTDGIDPDSCTDVVIEDCYISVGDDAVAIKSGWDQYGIKYGRPSANIIIRNLIAHAPVSAAISIGSEMSGGVTNVSVENLLAWGSRRGLRIKTSAGRGGYVTNIRYKNVRFEAVRVGIAIKTDYGEHPDDFFDPLAYPKVANISFHDVYGEDVRIPVRIYGTKEIPVTGLEFKNVYVGSTKKKKHVFQCSFVEGRVVGKIQPNPCADLVRYPAHGVEHELYGPLVAASPQNSSS